MNQTSKNRPSSTYEPTLRDIVAPIVRDVLAEERTSPVMISQNNCEAAFGISSRTHLENCRRADFTPEVTKLGKLRLVDAAEYQAWLREIGRRERHRDEHVDPEDGAAALLRELGLHEVKAPSKKSSRSHATRDLARTTVG